MERPISRTIGISMGIICLLWGYNFLAIKLATTFCNPILFACLRSFIATLILFFVCWISKKRILLDRYPTVFLAGIFQMGFFPGLLCLSMEGGTCGNSSVLALIAPVWVLILNRVLYKDPLKSTELISTLTACLGLGFVFEFSFLEKDYFSKFLAFLAGVSLAIGIFLTKSLNLETYSKLLSSCMWQMLSGSLFLFILVLFFGEFSLQPNYEFFVYLLFSAIPAGAFAWVLWFFILKNASPNITSATIFLIPTASLVLSFIHFKERLTLMNTVGIFLILGSLVFSWGWERFILKRNRYDFSRKF